MWVWLPILFRATPAARNPVAGHFAQKPTRRRQGILEARHRAPQTLRRARFAHGDALSGQSGRVEEVVLDAESGRSLTLRRTQNRDSEGHWSYHATLTLPEGQVTTEVNDYGDLLGPFTRDLANAWRGFDGTKEYESLEGHLVLSCTHDGVGMVECKVMMRQPWPGDWRVEAVLRFGAGAHLERLAGQVEAFVAGGA